MQHVVISTRCCSQIFEITYITSHSLKKCQKYIKRAVMQLEQLTDIEAVERIRETFIKFDTNKNGSLEFAEFEAFLKCLRVNMQPHVRHPQNMATTPFIMFLQ
jgi:hypothetical protein